MNTEKPDIQSDNMRNISSDTEPISPVIQNDTVEVEQPEAQTAELGEQEGDTDTELIYDDAPDDVIADELADTIEGVAHVKNPVLTDGESSPEQIDATPDNLSIPDETIVEEAPTIESVIWDDTLEAQELPIEVENAQRITDIVPDEPKSTDDESDKAPRTVSENASLEEDIKEDVELSPKEEEPKERFIDVFFDFIELCVFTLATVLIITSFFIRHSVVDGDSMLGTLEDGQHLLISDFMYEPENGDIIVCEDMSTLLKKPIIKRVIATEGQKVRISATAIYVDGKKLNEPYVYTSVDNYQYDIYPSSEMLKNETIRIEHGEYYEFTVPDGEVFVMGDHRNNSADSRHIGTVDEDAILGKVILRFYPFNKFGTVTD